MRGHYLEELNAEGAIDDGFALLDEMEQTGLEPGYPGMVEFDDNLVTSACGDEWVIGSVRVGSPDPVVVVDVVERERYANHRASVETVTGARVSVPTNEVWRCEACGALIARVGVCTRCGDTGDESNTDQNTGIWCGEEVFRDEY